MSANSDGREENGNMKTLAISAEIFIYFANTRSDPIEISFLHCGKIGKEFSRCWSASIE